MQESQNQISSQEEIHLLDYILILAKHSLAIIYASTAAAVLTYLFLFMLPNTYLASALMLPPQTDTSLSARLVESMGIGSVPGGSSSGGLGGLASGLFGLKSPNEQYLGMLNSNTIFDKIIKRYDLRDYFGRRLTIEEVRKKLRDRAKISSSPNNLIQIEVTDEDPQRAADMANSFVSELDHMLQNIARQDARNYLVFLEKERSQANKKLSKAEETLRSFSEKTSVLQIDAQTKGMLEYIAGLRATIDAKEVQLMVLRQKVTPSNYDFIGLETELKGLKEKLREAENQANQTCLSEICLPTSKVPSLGMEYFRLVRDVKYQEASYQVYCKLVELARMETVRAVSMVQVVDRATPPERKSNKRLLPALLVGCLAFFLMVCGVFTAEWLHQIKCREEESNRLAVIKEYLQPYARILDRLKKLITFRK